jgi:hypothetical protein
MYLSIINYIKTLLLRILVMIMAKVNKKDTKDNKKDGDASRDEQIGFHKGALSTLSKERSEMARILQIVEQLMQMHVTALTDLGVDLRKEVEEMKTQDTAKPGKKKPIEDVL